MTKPKQNKAIACTQCGTLFERTGHRGGGRATECSIRCRFFSKVTKAANGCHEWAASVFKTGYGQFAVSARKPETAHRMAWLLQRGEIPEGLQVLHKCDNRKCANVEHLFLGTQADNVADMMSKGRHWSQYRERSVG